MYVREYEFNDMKFLLVSDSFEKLPGEDGYHFRYLISGDTLVREWAMVYHKHMCVTRDFVWDTDDLSDNILSVIIDVETTLKANYGYNIFNS